MADKLRVWFTTGSGLTLVAIFLVAGLKAIETHLSGSYASDVAVIISFIGLLTHPTDMVAGRKISK